MPSSPNIPSSINYRRIQPQSDYGHPNDDSARESSASDDPALEINLRVYLNKKIHFRGMLPESTHYTLDLCDIEAAFLEHIPAAVKDLPYEVTTIRAAVRAGNGRGTSKVQDFSDFSLAST
jgi:hypothetical protein